MRTGFSTSACAAAAAAAAVRVLAQHKTSESINIDLPSVKGVNFRLSYCEMNVDLACCGVIKDAGDDPDVTNGLEIRAEVSWAPGTGISLQGGRGVGKVTLPGLPVAVGEAAINPGPRRLVLQVIKRELHSLQLPEDLGLKVIIQVPEGEKAAVETMNPKLGIEGGISILGTDGLVRPFSAPAFRASLFYELRVALKNGYSTIGLATGKRSGAYLREALEDARGLGVVEAGDELGYPLDQAARLGFKTAALGGMIGKISKLAQRRFQTHVQEGEVDFDFLSAVAAGRGAPPDVCERIRTARTAHQVQGWLRSEGLNIEPDLAQKAAEQMLIRVKEKMNVAVFLFDLTGILLGHAELGALHGE